MLARHRTQVVFWTALTFSLVTLALAFVLHPAWLAAVAASVGFNIWSLVKNERDGFVKTNQARRAYEPARHFNVGQVFLMMALVMIQLAAAAYILLTLD